ncbi:ubiquitin fusion degradation protein 1 homolog [Coffea eugenioides]|uniref:ubiquitin fusion degradation protein 1 homolog n=1 Tax=Coffea eugenioides TaxID=49369 RepID=UPI000F60B272|nr:ubiquitin fusion degradation protein 1 homolog [Coffea eugenioides]
MEPAMEDFQDQDYEYFEQSYNCFPVSHIKDREYLEDGNRIVMPPSALERLVYMDNIEYPMVFEIKKPTTTAAAAASTNTTTRGGRDDNEGGSQQVSHCGVLEFSADEGFVYVPEWMMKYWQIHPGSIVVLKYVTLPRGSFMKIQPHRMNFIKLPDPKEILETALKDFACVTAGDTIMITHQYNRYYIDILETNPSNAISLFETDCEVDFAPSLDYKEPEKQPPSSVVRAAMDADPRKVQEKQTSAQDDDQQPKFKPFVGAARRLDEQPASIVPRAASSTPPSSQLPVKESSNRMASEAQPLSRKRAGKLVFGPEEVGNQPSKSRRISEELDNKKNATSAEENKFIPFTGKKYTLGE